MKNAVIYIRVSTDEQAGEGHHSLAAQKSICSKLATDLGYHVMRVFEDAGKSASSMKRAALQEMIELCQKDLTVTAVVVQDTDRLARNTQDHLAIRAILKKHKVQLISASQPTIDDTPEGQMIDTIVASVNQFQSDITARKTLKGMEEKARKGWLPGKAPLGYKNHTNNQGDRVVSLDEPVATRIREAFRLYATGRYSVAYLRDLLYDQNLRSRTGKKLQHSRLNELLKNRFYLGELRWGSIHLKNGGHPALIDSMTFDQVQNVMAVHNRFANRRRKHDFLLRGVLYCATCSHRLVAEKHARKHAAYYHCAKRGFCPSKKYAGTLDLETEVGRLFEQVQFTEAFIGRVTTKAKRYFDSKKQIIENERIGLHAQQAELKRKRDTLERKLLDGLIDDDDFQRIRNSLRLELEKNEQHISKLERVRDNSLDVVCQSLELSRNVALAYRNASSDRKKHLLALFWERFEVDGYNISTAIPSRLFRALLQQSAAHKTHKPVLLGRASAHGGGRHPRKYVINHKDQLSASWGGQWDSNPQPLVPQTSALPLSYGHPATTVFQIAQHKVNAGPF